MRNRTVPCVLLAGVALILAVTAFSDPIVPGFQNQQNNERQAAEARVRRYLARSEEDEGAIRELFETGDSEIPSLVKALREGNEQARTRAAKGIAYIGTTPGVEALRGAVERERDKKTKAVLSFFLAGRLADAQSKADFDFLVSSVNTALAVKDPDEDEAFPAVTAVLALSLTGKTDYLPVLRKATELDFADSEEIVKAVHWVEKESVPGHDRKSTPTDGLASNEEDRIKRVVLDRTFFAEGNQTSIDRLTLNASKNEALVSLTVGSRSKGTRGYDLVLSRASGEWRVVGIWFGWIS